MTTSESADGSRPPCPQCDAAVRFRTGIETCEQCGWVRVQGAD
ncbi:hypothetical protein [Halorussus aquaticus]|uniref:Transcription factor zinc-finger domain-containing protein n=1 Tax=Halorussus aquaticus TaxID=2953748 RepID=A0ABD5Q377_9EURY|nr:hypothetical protein [Halorussus aquaticus]